MSVQNKSFGITNRLKDTNVEFKGDPAVLGMSGMTFPMYVDAMRSVMYTGHLNQFLNMIVTEPPKVATHMENIVGEHSCGHKEAKEELVVVKKIVKFDGLLEHPNVYTLIVYDAMNDVYDVVTRNVFEDLVENFGFMYVNTGIDSYGEGDVIKKGSVLYHSTSYDPDTMDYGYGQNMVTAYMTDSYTSEDAASISVDAFYRTKAPFPENIVIGLNSNEYLMNSFGDEYEHLGLPKIGEPVDKHIAVVRPLYNDQILSDFNNKALKDIRDGDIVYKVDDNTIVTDYTIYDNNDVPIENPFYNQINELIHYQDKYYKEIVDTCVGIMNGGGKLSSELDALYDRAMDMIDKEKKWKIKDSVFDNMKIEVSCYRLGYGEKGNKYTGRYGNKSVIANIRPNDEMPYTHDGRRVDLIISLLGIVNRTTGFVLYEIFINNASYQIRQHMLKQNGLKAKEKILFDYINILNEDECVAMREIYNNLSKEDKEDFIESAIKDGITIYQSPMWEKKYIWYRIIDLLNKYDGIVGDVDLYVKKWNREYKILTKFVIGEMYTMRLKQSDRRGFSVRNTGALDARGLPTKSFKSKYHLEKFSSNCIRFGEFETLNFSIGILPADIALFHALYRTSIKGRRDFTASLFKEEGVLSLDKSYKSIVGEIFRVIMKSLGVELEFINTDEIIQELDDDSLEQFDLNGETIMCSPYQHYLLERYEEVRKDILSENPIMLDSELERAIEKELKARKYINGPLLDDIDENLKEKVDKEVDEILAKMADDKVLVQ